MFFEQTRSELVISNERVKAFALTLGTLRAVSHGRPAFPGSPPLNHLESYEDYRRD